MRATKKHFAFRISHFAFLATVPLVPLCLSASVPVTNHSVPNTKDFIQADYVEARTASVFAGACHFNGELVTTGSDAILALHITAGSWNNTDLTGLTAMAAVHSTDNLSKPGTRKSELVIDPATTDAQLAAFKSFLITTAGDQLGTIVSVTKSVITFQHADRSFTVTADNFAHLSVDPMPNDECCKQPSLVWYTPLLKLIKPKVGYTNQASSTSHLADPWNRSDENSAFYGTINR